MATVACSSEGDLETRNVGAETSPSTTADSPVDDRPTGALAEAALESPAAIELDRVRFVGIDSTADLDDLELLMSAPDSDPVAITLYLDDQGLFTTIPLHPTNPGGGGPVDLQLRQGDQSSELLHLDLGGLPPSPGAWVDTTAAMLVELDARATAAGTDLDQLASTPIDQLSGDLAVIKFLAALVDDGTDADLGSLPTSSSSQLDEDGLALLDAIVAAVDPFRIVPARTPRPQGFTRLGGAEARHGSVSPRQAGECQEFDLVIENGDDLADAINIGVSAQVVENGAVDRLVEDVIALSESVGDVPVVGEVVGYVRTLYSAMGLWFEIDAGRYPTELVSLEAVASIESFNEDFTEPGVVEAATVTATSTGFDASNGFAEVASEIVAAVGSKIVGEAKKEVGTLDAFDEAAIDAGEQLRDGLALQLLEEFGDQFLVFCPQQWQVQIGDPDFIEITSVLDRLDVDSSALAYEPREIGEGLLRVAARSDVFHGRSADTELAITTEPIRVIARPPKVTIDEAGVLVAIEVAVEHADTQSLAWLPEHGAWADGSGTGTGGPAIRELATPTDPALYPFLVEIEATSSTGLRAESDVVRNALVEIDLRELRVQPNPGNVEPGDTLLFSATDSDGDPQPVSWTATGGTIDENGRYIAGEVEGTYTVTATLIDDPSITVTVTVEVAGTDAFCRALGALLAGFSSGAIPPAALTAEYIALAEIAPPGLVQPLAVLADGNAILVATRDRSELPDEAAYDAAGMTLASYAMDQCGLNPDGT